MEIPRDLKLVAGTYCIKNITNHKGYYGSSIDLNRRLHSHIKSLRGGNGQNVYLQRAYDKYGENQFEIVILERFESISKEDLLQKEQALLDYHKPYLRENGYNISPSAFSNLGYKKTDEQRKKSSAGLLKFYEEHPEARKKVSERMKGEKNPQFGKLLSKEHRQKIRESNARPCTEETKEKISSKLVGRKRSLEDRQKMSKPRSEIGKQNITKAAEKREKKIYQFSEDGNLIKAWKSAKEVQDQLSFLRSTITAYARNNKLFKTFFWSYNDRFGV